MFLFNELSQSLAVAPELFVLLNSPDDSLFPDIFVLRPLPRHLLVFPFYLGVLFSGNNK